MLRAESNLRLSISVDNRIRFGPQQTSRSWHAVGCAESNRTVRRPLCPWITEPLRPATIVVVRAGPPGVEPGPARLELAVLPLHHRPDEKRTARVERASPEWGPGALPAELRPRGGTPGWTRTSGLCRRGTALCPLSYGRVKEPPAGIEPAPRPYKGRVLAVDTTEAKWRRSESNRHRPRCKRGARPVELHPRGGDGGARTRGERADRGGGGGGGERGGVLEPARAHLRALGCGGGASEHGGVSGCGATHRALRSNCG